MYLSYEKAWWVERERHAWEGEMEGRRKNNKQKTPKEQKRRVRGMTWKDRVPELEREEDARKIERDNQCTVYIPHVPRRKEELIW